MHRPSSTDNWIQSALEPHQQPRSTRRFRVWTSREFERVIRQLIVDGPQPAEAYKRHRIATHPRSRVVVYQSPNHAWVLKRFNVLPDKKAKRAVTRSLGRRAWNAALALQRLGLHTPRTLALAEERWATCLRGTSYLVSEYIAAPTLGQIMRNSRSSHGDRVELLRLVVSNVQKLHNAGFIHGDLRADNLLIDKDRLFFIDLDAFSRRCHPRHWRSGIENEWRRLGRTLNEPDRQVLTELLA